MKSTKSTWLLALVACLLALWGAPVAAAAPAGDHLPQTKDPQSARFDIEGSISTSGETRSITGNGAVSGTDLMLDMELSAPSGASGPDKVGVSIVVKGDKLYLKLSGLSPTGEEEKWYVTDYEGAGGTGAMTGMDMEAAHSALTVKSTAEESVHGVATTRYNIDVDTEALIPPGQQPTSEEAQVETTMTLTLWVGDADMYVHRLAMDVESVATVGETTSFVRMNLTMTFKDFNTPITIDAPANAEPLDFGSALGGIPVGGVLGGMPGMTTGMGTGMPRAGSGSPLMPWNLALLALGVASLAGGLVLRKRAV